MSFPLQPQSHRWRVWCLHRQVSSRGLPRREFSRGISWTGTCLALSLLAVGCAGLRLDRPFRAGQNDWLMYGGDQSRVNRTTAEIAPPLELLWEYNALAGITSSPLVRDSVMLVTTLHGELQAVNMNTGKRLGYVVLESSIAGTPAWDGANVYIPISSGSESLVCLGLNRAERRWAVFIGSIESSPLIVGEQLFVTTLGGVLYALNKIDGEEIWKFETAPKGRRKPIRSSPASDGEVLVFGSDDGTLYGINLKDGSLRWKYQTSGSIFGTPIIKGGHALVGSQDGWLYSVDVMTGSLRWKYETGSRIFGPASANHDLVFIGSADGQLHAVNTESGKNVWTFSTRSVINSAPLVAGAYLYFGSLDRTLYTLRAETGEELWRLPLEGRVKVSPVLWGNTLLVTYEDKFISALRHSRD
ncbi:MAG: PQQ-binding-like beta-propeller repeat protein [Bacteroidota bacterium]